MARILAACRRSYSDLAASAGRYLFNLVLFVCASTVCVPVMAQPAGADFGGRRPVERAPMAPAFEPAERPPVQLPPLAPPGSGALPTVRVFVREIRLSGNTVFTTEELKEIISAYENRQITTEELEELRNKLTLQYVNAGYINSGAVIPDQKVEDGVIDVTIVEGTLTDIQVEGTETLRPNYVSDRLELGAGPPLNVNDLQERLQLLLQTPYIERINADLRPGDRPGEAKLRAEVEEDTPGALRFRVDNRISPSIGQFRGVAQGTLYNPTGRGDVINAELEFAEGLSGDIYAGYSLPLNRWDTTLALFGEKTDSEVVEEPFDDLDIESETWSAGFQVSHPVYRTPQRQLNLSAGFERRSSETFIFDNVPFSFSPDRVPPDGESDISVIRLSQDWLSRSREQVLALRSTFSVGIDAFGATVDELCGATKCKADGEFWSWLGQLQWARRLGDGGAQVIFRADGQIASDALLPLEQYEVGGALSVRGYRENLLVRDEGYSASLELRVPVLRNQLGQSVLQIAPFVDAGGASNRGGSTPDPDNIQSAGLGLRWDPNSKVHAELYWGHAFRNVDFPDDDIQDDGFHFLVELDVFN